VAVDIDEKTISGQTSIKYSGTIMRGELPLHLVS